MNPIIAIRKLKKSYGDKVVLGGIDLDIYKGEIFGIVGMSGSGKTTVLNTLIGFVKPEQGNVFFNHDEKYHPIDADPLLVNSKFGFASQDMSVYPGLSVQENLEHFGILYGLSESSIKKNSDVLLKLTDLHISRATLASELSGGMQKRLSIACALIHNPDVLILDEPTGSLDPVLARKTWKLLRQINSKGTTIIIASHFLDQIEKHCHRIAILNKSKILHTGSPSSIVEHYLQKSQVHISTAEQRYHHIISEIAYDQNIEDYSVTDEGLVVHTRNSHSTISYLMRAVEQMGETIVDIGVKKPTLDDVFHLLIK